MFHRWDRWVSEDSGGDHCLRCGVVTPDFGKGVISDHGPLPIACPGDVANPHHFFGRSTRIECHFCGLVIDDETLPADVNWECEEN